MNKIIGAALAILFVGFAMYLSAAGAGVTIKGYIDIISFFLVFGVSYFGMVAAYGTFIPDMKGIKLMNELFMPAGWLGFMIGAVMMLYGMGGGDSENMAAKIGLSIAVALMTVLYSILFRIVFTIIIASKE